MGESRVFVVQNTAALPPVIVKKETAKVTTAPQEGLTCQLADGLLLAFDAFTGHGQAAVPSLLPK